MNSETAGRGQAALATAVEGAHHVVAQMRALLYSAVNYVRPEMRNAYEAKLHEHLRVLDDLLTKYEAELRSAPQQRLETEGKLYTALRQNTDVWGKSVRQAGNGGWVEIKDEWHAMRRVLECKDRQLAFATTGDEAEFRQQLWWMMEAEAHDGENLPLVRQARRQSRFQAPHLNRLLAQTEEMIARRFYAPQTVVEREERAYQQQRVVWDSAYRGQLIAIHLGEIIAAHADRSVLVELLRRRQQEEGPLRAYVVQIGGPVLDCTRVAQPLINDDIH